MLRPRIHRKACCRRGYTLLELLAVMVLIVMIMTIGIGGYMSMTEGAAMRSALTTVQTAIGTARGFAVARTRKVTLSLSSNDVLAFYMVSGVTSEVQQTSGNFLPRHVYLTDTAQNPLDRLELSFYPDGSAGMHSNVTIEVHERGGQKAFEIRINGLTGSTTITDITP